MTETIAGSARRALEVLPPFQHFVFIEQDKERCSALGHLRKRHPDRDITVHQGEANSELRRLLRTTPWVTGESSQARGVVFLDPYALQVEWATLLALAETRICDVWYLFPLRDVVRQLAHDIRGIGPKEVKLDAVLGVEWRELYSIQSELEQGYGDLFGRIENTSSRNATQAQIEAWFRRRLEVPFPYVSEPLPLLSGDGRQKFSLFLCVANPGGRAINLAKQFVRYAMRQHNPRASRQRSAR